MPLCLVVELLLRIAVSWLAGACSCSSTGGDLWHLELPALAPACVLVGLCLLQAA